MFGRGKRPKFDITEHPDVVRALNAMWDAAYSAGLRDAVAVVRDLREEVRADTAAPHSHYLDALDEVAARLDAQ